MKRSGAGCVQIWRIPGTEDFSGPGRGKTVPAKVSKTPRRPMGGNCLLFFEKQLSILRGKSSTAPTLAAAEFVEDAVRCGAPEPVMAVQEAPELVVLCSTMR